MKNPLFSRGSTPSEIHDRIRKGYLLRLDSRVKRMRKLFAERNWQEFRQECAHLKNSAASFGYPQVSQLAQRAEMAIPVRLSSRAIVRNEMREAAENLFNAIDSLLHAEESQAA